MAMKKGSQSSSGAAGGTGSKVKKATPKTEIGSPGQQLRWNDTKPGDCRGQEKKAWDAAGE